MLFEINQSKNNNNNGGLGISVKRAGIGKDQGRSRG